MLTLTLPIALTTAHSSIPAPSPGVNCGMSPEDCARYYSCQFPAMVADWRASFSSPWTGTQTDFVFLFVGLPAYVQDLPSQVRATDRDNSRPSLRTLPCLDLPRN